MKKPHQPKTAMAPYIALLVSTAIWGAALPVIKLTQGSVPPFTFLLLRFMIIGVLMLPVVFIELKKTPVHPADIKNLILLGILGQGSLAFIFWGVKFTSTIDTALIGTIAPLLTIFAGHYFYNEKVNNLTKFGIGVATIGTTLIVFEPIIMSGNHSAGSDPVLLRLLGNVLVLGYNVLFTIYIIYSKVVMGELSKKVTSFLRHFHVREMKRTYSPLLSTVITFYIGLAVFIPFALLENTGAFGLVGLDSSKLTTVPIIGILYMAILSSIVAAVAYEWGIKKAEVSDGAIFGYLGPLFTIPASFIILNEIPTRIALSGALIITIGVIIAEKYKHSEIRKSKL